MTETINLMKNIKIILIMLRENELCSEPKASSTNINLYKLSTISAQLSKTLRNNSNSTKDLTEYTTDDKLIEIRLYSFWGSTS